MKISYRSLLLIFHLLVLSNNACSDDTTVKIGAMIHLTGEYAMQGEAFRQGAELAIEKLNKDFGGKPYFEAVFEDTQYKPLVANGAAKKLAAQSEVIGTVVSTVTEGKSAGKVFEDSYLPAIVLWDSSPELEAIGDYVFGIGPWAPASGEEAAKFAHSKLKAKTVAIINTNTEWSIYVSDYFEKQFKAMGGKVTSRIALDPSETDFRSILVKVNKDKPDVYYVPSDSNILTFFKQIKQAGIKAPLITSDILDIELFESGGDLFEGVYQTQAGDPNFPQTSEMIAAYKAKYSKEPDFLLFTAWAYDAVRLLGQTSVKIGTERRKIKDQLYNIKDFEGASGPISFDSKGSSPRAVKILQVKKRKLVAVD